MALSNKTKKWLRSGVETFIHGATSSIASNVAISWVNPLAFADWPSKFKVAALCFAANGGLRLLQWWNANPLPEQDTAPPVPGAAAPAQISLNPFGKVVPLAQQPPVPAPDNQAKGNQ